MESWFRIVFAAGTALALIVLVNSIANYALVSRRIAMEQVRREMARTAVALEARLHQTKTVDQSELASIVSNARAASGNIAWIEARTRDRSLTARAGLDTDATFTDDRIRQLMRSRQPVTTTRELPAGDVAVEIFPARIAGVFGQIEIAAWADGATVALWPLRRNFIINSSAAIALLICLLVMKLRFRSWLRGRDLENQLGIAKDVQDALLPAREQTIGGVTAATECFAYAGVGGDLHDVFETDDGKVALVAGDVSGKGLPAALLMGVIHGAVRSGNWYESAAAHADASERLNRLLCERAGSSRFASLVWGAYDLRRSKFRYVNAGHCRPLLVRSPNEILRLDDGGPVLGLLPQVRYAAAEVDIATDDVLVLYSDGLAEAVNERDEEFGEDRIRDAIASCGSRDPEQLRASILSAVREFAGEKSFSDDLTLVVARFEQTAALAQAA